MAFLNNLDQLIAVEWGAKYLWDIQFVGGIRSPAPPAPFDAFFPAVDVEEDLAHLDSYNFDGPQDQYKVPMSSSTLHLRVTFYDDEKHTLLTWLKTWINTTILNDGQYVSTLDACIKKVFLVKLDHRRKPVGTTAAYWVYPEGTITYSGDSASDPLMYTVSFVITGKDFR